MANRVAEIIKECGLSRLAAKLGHRFPSKVQGWRDRSTVPPAEIPAFLDAVRSLGIKATADDVIGPAPEKTEDAA